MPHISAILALLLTLVATSASGQTASAPDHSPWTSFLEHYVIAGEDGIARVAYGNVSPADQAALGTYTESLEATAVSTLPEPEQMTFWINLYNAVTVEVILEHYPVASIRRIKFGNPFALGPWGRKLVTVEGRELSLDNIEHDILRAEFDEPRIHFAVNCASIGCPNLQPIAFRAETLDAQLDAAARAYINHPRGVRIEDSRLIVSSIFNWFDEDFGGSEERVLAYLRQYADTALLSTLEGADAIDEYEYDWSLNDTRNSE